MCHKHLHVPVNFPFFFSITPIAILPSTFIQFSIHASVLPKNHFLHTLRFIFLSRSVMIAPVLVQFPYTEHTKENQRTSKIKIYRQKFFRFSDAFRREIKVNSISWLFHVSSRGAVKSATVYLLFPLAVVAIKRIYSTSKIQL